MNTSLTSADFKSKLTQIKADWQLGLLYILFLISVLVFTGGLIYVWVSPATGVGMIFASGLSILITIIMRWARVEELTTKLGLCCDGCGMTLVDSMTTPKFPVGICSSCGSETISDLVRSSANFTLMLERSSFRKGFYKALGEEAAKICLVAVKCFIGAMAVVGGLALATSLLLSFLRALVDSIFNNG